MLFIGSVAPRARRRIATIAAAVAAVAGAVCLIVRYKDELAELCSKIARKVSRPAEYDDFADVDEFED